MRMRRVSPISHKNNVEPTLHKKSPNCSKNFLSGIVGSRKRFFCAKPVEPASKSQRVLSALQAVVYVQV
jgi:hypothetical protein